MFLCNVVSRWAQLVSFLCRSLKIITDSDLLQIQNYKIEMQLKLKVHQLWRIALWFGKLQLSVFLKIVWVFWLERVLPPVVIVFGLFCYCHSVIKSRATCRPKSRCQSDLSTVSVLANRSLHQDLMHSGCRGTAVPNVCLQAFSLFPLPTPPTQSPRNLKTLFQNDGKFCFFFCCHDDGPFPFRVAEASVLKRG